MVSPTTEVESPVPILTTTTVPPTAPPTTALVTTTTLPGLRLPAPSELPADAYAPTPDEVVATISIPSLGVEADVHSGMTLTALNRGPSWWPGTALPGQLGNVVIGGHRTTYSRPFRDLDQLEPGGWQAKSVAVYPSVWSAISTAEGSTTSVPTTAYVNSPAEVDMVT